MIQQTALLANADATTKVSLLSTVATQVESPKTLNNLVDDLLNNKGANLKENLRNAIAVLQKQYNEASNPQAKAAAQAHLQNALKAAGVVTDTIKAAVVAPFTNEDGSPKINPLTGKPLTAEDIAQVIHDTGDLTYDYQAPKVSNGE